jgi:hypothetical protein
MTQAPHTVELDEHLKEVVAALHQAVNYGLPHVNEPEVVDKAIADCKEVLDVVMEGKVSEWIQ